MIYKFKLSRKKISTAGLICFFVFQSQSSILVENDANVLQDGPPGNQSRFKRYMTMGRGVDYLYCDGSDCGMNWRCLLLFALAICVIVPIIIIGSVYGFHFINEHINMVTQQHNNINNSEPKHMVNFTYTGNSGKFDLQKNWIVQKFRSLQNWFQAKTKMKKWLNSKYVTDLNIKIAKIIVRL